MIQGRIVNYIKNKCSRDTMILKTRTATKNDFSSIWNLLKQLFARDNLSKVKTQTIFFNSLKDRESIELVLELKNHIIGYVAVKFRNDVQAQGQIGYLSELIIEESFQGKGFGKKLLKELFSILGKTKCKEVNFPSNFKRKKAHRFYEALGFNKTAYYFWKEL